MRLLFQFEYEFEYETKFRFERQKWVNEKHCNYNNNLQTKERWQQETSRGGSPCQFP